MCCRYYIGGPTVENLSKLTGEDPGRIRVSDIRPAEIAPVLMAGMKKETFALRNIRWGFLPVQGSGLVINARCETVTQKRLFRDSFRARRCLVPADGFYEWDAAKQKHTFTVPGCGTIYLAGISGTFGGEDRFTILTTAANESMVRVHDRMPLIIPAECCSDWLTDLQAAAELLTGPSALLQDSFEPAQLSLF